MDFEVERNDLHTTRICAAEPVALEVGQLRLHVDRFSLTSNNVTYAVFGEAMKYWNFFPASESGWGRIPVWGFADVVESRSSDIAEGTRVYGYLPMSTDFVVTPGRADERGFTDVAEHRRAMANTYNRYLRVDSDPLYVPEREDHQMLLWPLFYTSFLIDDVIAERGFCDATSVVISSASSKTAIVAAYLLHRRGGVEVVGLTSSTNRDFVEGLGCYSTVVTYDQIETVPVGRAVYVDISGSAAVRASVHAHFGDDLKCSMMVGGTHWDQAKATAEKLAGPTPEIFFAPTQISIRNKTWGADVLEQLVGSAWDEFVSWASERVEFHYAIGPEAVEDAYRELLEGRADPGVGYVCSL